MRNALLLGLSVTLVVGCGGASAAAAPAGTGPIALDVDARAAGTGRIKSHLSIPARPGELALVYPKWIPGEHSPNGPIVDVAGLRASANGKALAWRRDPDDMHQIRVTVPAGVAIVEIDFESIRNNAGPTNAAAPSSARFVSVVWNQAVLYPKGARASEVTVIPSVRLPEGWKYATALDTQSVSDGTVHFARTTLEKLVDSPVMAGAYVKTYDLGTTRGAAHSLVAVGESEAGLAAPEELVAAWKRLVVEANALFGARHYDSYRFLLLESDSVPSFGLEHHQSSEDHVKERMLVDGDMRRLFGDLLPHEYAHSWNGKYRRPRGLATADYQQPMRGELLWVYEGLTEYLGWVLAARSGLMTVDDAKAVLASNVISVDGPGRTWRPLADTTTAAQVLYSAPEVGDSFRRGVDFYPEGLLVWLEVDTLIRQKTSGARSLDDFCKRFHGGKDGGAEVRPYDLDEVVKTLNAVTPYDWKTFFDQRVYQIAAKVPTGGIDAAGYKLAFTDKKPDWLNVREKVWKSQHYWESLGFNANEDNVVTTVLDGGPSAKAGLTPKTKILGVDGRKFSSDTMSDALVRAKQNSEPIELLVEGDTFYRILKVDWHRGETYRVLERDASKPDLLAAILSPTATKLPAPPATSK